MKSRRVSPVVERALILILFGFVAVFPARSISYGQVSKWSPPVAFEQNGWFPDIAADRSGRIHVAWAHSVQLEPTSSSGQRVGYDVVMYTNSDNGNTWAPINEVAAFPQVGVEVTRPALLADPNGTLHMTFRDNQVFYSHAPALEASAAKSWLPPQMLNNNLAYFSRVAIDSKGVLHTVFTENMPSGDCPVCFHIFYRSSSDNGLTWSVDTDISTLPTGAAKPQIFIDNRDAIHVVWESGRGGGLGQLEEPTKVMYTVSYNGGDTWSLPIEFTAPNAVAGKNITIGSDKYDNLVVAWMALPDSLVYYQVSVDHGLSWSEPLPIPGVWSVWEAHNARLDSYAMQTDADGHLHMIMVGLTAPNDEVIQLFHLTWDGTTWLPPESVVSYADGDVPEWPRLAVRNGNELHLVWFVRPADYVWAASPNYYKVWYSHARIPGRRISPSPWPTLTSTAPATPTAGIQPTSTPTALAMTPLPPGVVVQQPEQEYYSEIGQLGVVGRSLLPALAVVAVLLVAVVMVKRR